MTRRELNRELDGKLPMWLVEFYTWVLVTGGLLLTGHLLGAL